MDELNVIFSSDDNYAQHLGVAIYSVLDKNRDFERVNIYIVDNEITEVNRERLEKIANAFSNGVICWIDFKAWREQLVLNMAWEISISAYARLFIGSMLPQSVNRIIYFDCDVVITNSLRKMWETDLKGRVIAAVQDAMKPSLKIPVGIKEDEPYFNSGNMLIDLKAWRENDTEKKCLAFIESKQGRVMHHDQGVLNGLFKNNWTRLPIEDDLMTVCFVYNLEKIKKYFNDKSEFYTEKEIEYAKNNPVILHYTPSFTTRPWVKGCKHPYKKLYWDILEKTPWKGAKPQKDARKWYVRIIEWRWRVLPF